MTTLTTSGRDINKNCNENLADKHWLIPLPPTVYLEMIFKANIVRQTPRNCIFSTIGKIFAKYQRSLQHFQRLPRTETSLCLDEHLGAKEDGKKKTGVSDFSLSLGPLRLVNSYSRFLLPSDVCLTCAKNEASEEGAASSKCVSCEIIFNRYMSDV